MAISLDCVPTKAFQDRGLNIAEQIRFDFASDQNQSEIYLMDSRKVRDGFAQMAKAHDGSLRASALTFLVSLLERLLRRFIKYTENTLQQRMLPATPPIRKRLRRAWPGDEFRLVGADETLDKWGQILPACSIGRDAILKAIPNKKSNNNNTKTHLPLNAVTEMLGLGVDEEAASCTAIILNHLFSQIIQLSVIPGRSIKAAHIEKVIREHPHLKKTFYPPPKTKNKKSSLKYLCASVVIESNIDYHDPSYDLSEELIAFLDEEDDERPMKLLLARIEKCLPELKASLEPTPKEDIRLVEKDFKISFPPELRAFLKWSSSGTPDAAPGFSDYLLCGSLSDIEEEFAYNVDFPTLFRRMRWLPIMAIDSDSCFNGLDIETGTVLQIDFENQSYSILSKSFLHSVQTYVTDLEDVKANGQPITKELWGTRKPNPEVLGKGQLQGKMLRDFHFLCTRLGLLEENAGNDSL